MSLTHARHSAQTHRSARPSSHWDSVPWILAVVLFLGGCAGDEPGASESGTASSGSTTNSTAVKLLFISNGNSDWWNAVEKGMQDGAAVFAASAELRRNDGTAAGQIRLLEDALSLPDVKGVAVSVIEAESPGVADAMRALQKAGKVVIAIDSDIAASLSDARRAYIGTNNLKAGEIAGQAAATLRPQGGKTVVFVGKPEAANAIERRTGFFQGAGPKFTQAEVFADDNDPNRAQENVRSAILKYPDAGVLLGLWSYNAPAIAEEVKTSPAVRQKVSVVTFDLDQRAVDQLEQGLIDVTVCQNPYEMGYQGVRLLKAFAANDAQTIDEMLPNKTSTIDTGVRIIIPQSNTSIKGENVITIDGMKKWLASKGLKSS